MVSGSISERRRWRGGTTARDTAVGAASTTKQGRGKGVKGGSQRVFTSLL
jgi:hypothetical protein